MAANPWLSGNLWYDPSSLYGGKKDLYDAPIVRDNLSDELPRGEWTRWLAGQNLLGQDNRSRFAQSQYNQAQAGFDAAALTNPNLRFRDYLKRLDRGGIADAWNSMTAGQRGVNPTSRSSVIRWG